MRNSRKAAELRRKSQLKVNLRLLNLLVIHQPKLLLHTAVTSAGTASTINTLEWVWDPLVEAIEAAVCPECGHPTFEFGVTRQGRLGLPGLRGRCNYTRPASAAVVSASRCYSRPLRYMCAMTR